jgi:E3 ubiquitin-protein ligase RNF13
VINFDSLSAGFGPSISDDGFEGYIAAAKPLSGCSKMEPPPNVTAPDFVARKWIALIQRTPGSYGNCSFDLKVFNAQKAGFSAVIIFNSESDNLIRMSPSGQYSIRIPSVFIGHSNGIEIMEDYTYLNKTYAVIYNDESDINFLLIPFVSVVSICFLIAICIFVSICLFAYFCLITIIN